ncbi:hypothetical protein T07_14837 [Trichinella nelsoni]|uniref:Secreted protein n=1 Tax=Trichinella nelsoni TaxID=6336 RepID=A0A0V0SB79_9BILA|nr:hypothetical protein T07_14837 [Trichinella nelsoni]
MKNCMLRAILLELGWLAGLKCEKLTRLATRVNEQQKSLTAATAVYWCLLPTTTTSIPKCRLAEVAAITAKPKMRVPKMKTQEMIPFAIASP